DVPFRAESTLGVLTKVVQEPPTPLRHIRREVPAGVEAICLRCLAKKPSERFTSAQALAEELGRFLAGEKVTVKPPAPRGRWRGWLGGAAGLAAGVLAGGLVAALGRAKPDGGTVLDAPEEGAGKGKPSPVAESGKKAPEPLDPQLAVRVQTKGQGWLAV